ncbi:MAG: peptidylprolyl isomerase [Acidobacteriota bacterium]
MVVIGGLVFAVATVARLQGEELPPAEKQVVFETSYGEIVLEVFPQAAPNHVAKFLERVKSGFYDGTAFHRAIPFGIIQGGDPLSRDPTRKPYYGTGGLGEISKENSPVSHRRGTLSAVLIPGNPDSAGSQFFICVSDQVQLDGQYTAYGRVVDGSAVVEKISQAATDARQLITERIELKRAYLRDRPPPEVIPFLETAAAELEKYRALIHSPLGDIRLAFYPQEAPEHVRQFLRFAKLGLYDGTTFLRVVPGFVLQGGLMDTRKPRVPDKYRALLKPLKAEFNQHKHVRGILSMARTDDPDSGMDSFFIVLDTQPHLDSQYTAFGFVEAGMDVVDAIVARPLSGETPVDPLSFTVEVREK